MDKGEVSLYEAEAAFIQGCQSVGSVGFGTSQNLEQSAPMYSLFRLEMLADKLTVLGNKQVSRNRNGLRRPPDTTNLLSSFYVVYT